MFSMRPSCVCATDMETSGGRLGYHDLSTFADKPWVLGLAEMMNYSGVIHRDNSVLKKIDIMKGKVIDGHAPGLSGKGLNAYISAGIRSDHECTTIEEAREKLEKGMYIMLREGTIAKNLKTLLPFITTENSRRFMFVTDDRNPVDIVNEGHINFMVKTAIKWGIDPITAVRMATLNPAEYFHLNEFGAIAPGYNADFIVFDNLKNFNIKKVFKRGRLVAENGCLIQEIQSGHPIHLRSSMNVRPLSINDLKVKAGGRLIKVIEIVSGQLITRKRIEKARVEKGEVISDVDREIIKVAVIGRHSA